MDFSSKKQLPKQIGIVLDIAFGEIEEKYLYSHFFGLIKKEGYLRFGIKFGTLNLKFPYKCMPAKQRQLPEAKQFSWKITSIGSDKNPEWQFKAASTSETKDQEAVLFGSLKNQELGMINLQDTPCTLEATFQVNINRNALGITAQDGVWDDQTPKKIKASKIRAFFKKVVEPKLKNNVGTIKIKI